jgi:pimeloyl-ACP methyl ester carboxylesterase
MVVLLLVATAARALAAEDAPPKPLPPEDVALSTADDLTIVATFYPSRLGKKAVPIMLLHGGRGNRGEWKPFALHLQEAGHAVLVPDLRGHGDSSRPPDRPGELRAEDYQEMVAKDLEAVKKFLVQRNNAGELNIEKLCLVGVEMGAGVAINFAASDWDWPVLATGKQGQDVKALVLVSPEWSFKGLRIAEAVAHESVRSQISMMIIVGKGNARYLAEARRLYSSLQRFHDATGGEGPHSRQTLWLKTPSTSLQGTRLVQEKSMKVEDMVAKFIDQRLVQQPLPWSERRSAEALK